MTMMGYQVITVNWMEAANSITLSGADWTTAIGAWVGNQLKAAGFTGNNVNLAGYSWGSYVSYFVGQNFGEVQSIVALDAAADGIATNRLQSSQIDFRSISKMSWAFESSPAGSNARALSADYSFTIDSGLARFLPDFRAHNFAVTTFSALIQDASVRKSFGEMTTFSPDRIMGSTQPTVVSASGEILTPAQDAYAALTIESEYWGDGWEGILKVDTYDGIDEQGRVWHKALPKSFEFKDTNGDTRTQLLNPLSPDATITGA